MSQQSYIQMLENKIESLIKLNQKLLKDLAEMREALELCIIETGVSHCPNPPEYTDLSREYDSDTPYIVQEGGCELDDHCLTCTANYFINKIKEKHTNE